jgi:hypothetical protein
MTGAQDPFVISLLPQVTNLELASRNVLDPLFHQLYAPAQI